MPNLFTEDEERAIDCVNGSLVRKKNSKNRWCRGFDAVEAPAPPVFAVEKGFYGFTQI